MQTEMDGLKKENDALKKELFVIKEIVQKHENAIESHQHNEMTTISTYVQQEINQPQMTEFQQDQKQDIDSNGKFIKPKLLCPDKRVHQKTSYTLNQALDNILHSNHETQNCSFTLWN